MFVVTLYCVPLLCSDICRTLKMAAVACEVLICSDENVQLYNNFITLFIAECFCYDRCQNCREDCKLFSYVFDIKFGLYFGLIVCLSHSPGLAPGVLKLESVSLVQIC